MLKRLFTLAALCSLPVLTAMTSFAQALPSLVLTNFGNFTRTAETSITANDPGVNSSYSMVAGGLDLWGPTDNGTFAFYQTSGDFDVRIRVQSMEAVHRYAKAGLMVRESLSSASRMVSIFATPTGPTELPPEEPQGEDEVEFNFRRATGDGSNNINLGSPGFPNAWLRLARRGSIIYGLVSRDGINWTRSTSVNTATWPGGALKSGVLLGIGSSAHDANRLIRSEYRDFSPVTTVGNLQILSQPANIQGVNGYTASFSIGLNDPVDAQYQWYVDNVAIQGATNSTYTTPTLPDAADQKRYKVVATGRNGTSVTSNEAVLDIVAISAPEVPSYVFDFEDGQVPPDAQVYGTAEVSPTSGVGGGGGLVLIPAANNQNGSFVVRDINDGVVVDSFTVAFKLKIGPGTTRPADGFSFNFGPGVPDAIFPAPQQGVGPGLAVSFDIYDNGDAEAPAIDIFYGVDPATAPANLKGNILHKPLPLSSLVTSRYVDVVIRMNPDGKLDMLYNGNVIAYQLQTGFVPTAGGKFGFGAYAGGQNAFHGIDDIQIATTQLTDDAYVSSIAPLGNNVSALPQIKFTLVDQATTVAQDSIKLELNGTQVVPEIGTDPITGATVVTYNVTSMLPSLSDQSVVLRWSDSAGNNRVTTSSFRVGSYITLPAAVAPVGSGKVDDEGFKVRVYQIANDLTPTTQFAESILAGERGENIADLVIADEQGYFTDPLSTMMIDYDVNAAPSGFSTFPGIPGITDSKENFAVEVLTFIEFPQAGFYQMAVRSDDGFLLTAGDEGNPTVLASFVGEREPSDTVFGFVAPTAGVYPFRMVYYQARGGGSVRWYTLDPTGAKTLLNNPNNPEGPRAFRTIEGGNPPPARLTITRNGINVTVGWTGAGTLESATELKAGQWSAVPNQTNPMSFPATGTARFFRVRQ